MASSNKAPAADADTAITASGAAVDIDVLSNDTDADGGMLAVALVRTSGTKGSVSVGAGDTLTYNPGTAFAYLSAGESATDRFTYTASDGYGGTSVATVTVTVTGVNQAPVAPNVVATTTAGSGVWLPLAGIDSDVNKDDVLAVTAVTATGSTMGTPKLNPAGTPANGFAYSPGAAFAYLSVGETATDTFTYTISDGHGGTSTGTATITVTGVNTPPAAKPDTSRTASGAPVTIDVLANDTDANRDDVLTVTSVSTSTAKGSVTIDADGTLTYNPGTAFAYLSAGETAKDWFSYTISDGHGGSATTGVTVTVTGVNQAPVAPNVTATAHAGSGMWVRLAGIDSDVNKDDVLTVTAVTATGSTMGTPKLNPAGTPANGFAYSPGAAFAYLSVGETATDTFTYTISDGHGGTSTGTATITIDGVNTRPVGTVDRGSTGAGHALTLDVLANDTDANRDDVLSVTSVDTSNAQGSAVVNADGTITYTPGGTLTYLATGKTRLDTFTYKVSDGHGGTSVVPVQVTVSGTWHAPVATADAAATNTQTPVTIDVLGNDTDPQSGVTLSVLSANTKGTNGSVVLNQDGTITYTPGSAFTGLVDGTATTDKFSYTVSDGHGGMSTAGVTITVSAPGAASSTPGDEGGSAPQAVYVSADGNDAWSGLLAKPNAAGTDGPKATLQAAEVVMRNSATIKTAYIESGDYYLSAPLNLGPSDAGESWLAYPGDTPVIHGGVQVTGWTEGANGVWTAEAPAGAFAAGTASTDLFYRGTRETLSRYPNAVPGNTGHGGWLTAAASLPGENSFRSFQFNAGDIPTFSSTQGLYVDIYSQNGWQNYILPVASIDDTTNTITLARPAGLSIGAGSRYYIFDAPSQLDAAGEWYYDSAANTISFKAPEGFDGSGVTLGTASNIFSIYNTNNVTVSGLTFAGSLNTGSAINVANSTGVEIAGNTISNVGVGVSFSSNSSNSTVEGNEISDTAGNGVQLPAGTHDISVVGNYIHDIGARTVASGVWLSGSSNDTVSYNLIQNTSKSGVSIGASSSGVGSYNDAISYNEIGYANQATSDGGAVYVNSQYRQDLTGDLIAYNDIYGTSAAGTVSSTGVASTSLLPASQLISYAIYLDDYASGLTVQGNYVHDNAGGIAIHSGWDNTVSGNFLVDNAGASLQNQVWNALGAGSEPSAHNVFSGNLVSTPGTSALASVNLGVTSNAEWTGNFYDASTLGNAAFGSLDSGSYRSASLSAWEALGYDTNAVSGDPGFTDPANGSYALDTGSAAFAAGIANLPFNEMGLAGYTGSYAYAWQGGVS